MRTHLVFGLAGMAVALAVVVPASAAPGPPSVGGLVLVQASDVAPAPGGEASAFGYLPLHPLEFAQAKADANARAGVHGGSGAPAAGGRGPIVTSYPNVSPVFQGPSQSGITPPDTTGAIGPDRYIETVNTKYGIYDRTGSSINTGKLSALTGISGGIFGHSLSDPQMMWDAKTQRFYYTAVYYNATFSDDGIAVGWSTTATPASSNDWCKYAIGFGNQLPDYVKLGDSSDFLVFGYNKFGSSASTYLNSEIATLNKPPAGAACAPTSAFVVYTSGALHNADASLAATPVPANLVDDSNGAGYVVANADLTLTPSANFISVYSVTTSGTDQNGIPIPSFSAVSSVSVSSYRMPADAPQQGTSYLLDTLDGRFEAAVAAFDPGHSDKLAIWTAHAVLGGGGAEERWYEIDATAHSLLQNNVVTDPSLVIWNSAVSPDRANNGTSGSFGDSMAMSVSTSSSSTYPAIQFVWKKGASAQSARMNIVQATSASIDFSCSNTKPCRWGDYSGASPDPAATGIVGKVWLANQFNLSGGTTSSTVWRTGVFAVTPT